MSSSSESSGRLASIRKYVEAATPGPWSKAVFAFGPPEGGDLSPVAHTRADAEFIARARTDMPLLLEVAKAAVGVLAVLGGEPRVWFMGEVDGPALVDVSAVDQLRAALARLEANPRG